MNLKEIREIVNLMNENDIAEIEVEREGGKLKIRKTSAGMPMVATMHPQNFIEMPRVAAPAGGSSTAPAAEPARPANVKEITAPMVGTFYRAPSPDSAPYVEIGQVVEVGQVVCIVEAMKLMNEIKSTIRGRILEIPVENAQPVEFGQALFIIEPL
jgi:acetyl-CoA carboxylase biotin carboxyl carrier protein